MQYTATRCVSPKTMQLLPALLNRTVIRRTVIRRTVIRRTVIRRTVINTQAEQPL